MHEPITPEEAADRLAIRELIDAYAHYADRRQPEEQAALYAEDGRTLVYPDLASAEPAQVLTGRAEHTEGFRVLSQYAATMHLIGQSTIALDGDRATGESYCIAHHLFTEDGERKLMVAWLRYGDTFVKIDGAWLFAQRNLYVDWTETRSSNP